MIPFECFITEYSGILPGKEPQQFSVEIFILIDLVGYYLAVGYVIVIRNI
jgi:hypothetical protein